MKFLKKHIFTICLSCSSAFAAPSGNDLYMAMIMQDVPKMKSLIAQGADVNHKENGRPIIVWAGQSANPEIVKLLIASKADINAADEGIGHTGLMRAVETQNEEMVNTLLAAKADPNTVAADGDTVLIMAIKSYKPEIVEAVVKAGADVKKHTKDGDSPALVAAQNNSDSTPEIIRILGAAHADLNASNIVYTPLVYVIQQGSVPIVKALLEAGADVNAKTESGGAPIDYADNKEIVELLVRAKADLNQVSASGSTPLLRAIENGDAGLVQSLLDSGADPNKADNYGNTPLQTATNYSKTEIAEILKKKGAI